MNTLDVRNLILNTKLREQPVQIADWPGTNLIIRELDGKTGSDLINACSDANGKPNQEALVAGIILASLRNADDPRKPLVFSADPENAPDTYAPAFRDSLMATGLGHIMEVAMMSIKLSGMDMAAQKDAKNASSATVVEGSLIA